MSSQNHYQISALPDFSGINTQNIIPMVESLIEQCRQRRDSLLADNQVYTWDNLVAPLDEQEEKLNQMFSPVRHLTCVANTPELREAYEQVLNLLTDYATEVGQHKPLYQAYKNIYESDQRLNDAQMKVLKDAIKAFEHSGVALEDDQREKFKQIQAKLAQLSNHFENNVLDATMGWEYHTEDVSELKGLSEDVLSAAQTKAQGKGRSGYLLGLDMPTYLAVMMHCDNRQLRETFYYEYCTRASDQGSNAGKWDNTHNIEKILELKYQQARLLGFDNYAELSIDDKMAESVEAVDQFLHDLLEKSKPQAQKELDQLKAFAVKEGLTDGFHPWDVAYYSEKLKQHLFDFSEEQLRKYFPLNKVLEGFFKVLFELYGLTVQEQTNFDSYHPDVRLLSFYDADNALRGQIYIDLFARDHKRGGAWMDECRARFVRLDGTIQVPVAYVNANFAPPQPDKEATLTHDDVLTLFHEFGHAMQHILTKVDYLPISGISGVEWDAVELPSQFMENFCWHQEGLNLISKHVETGHPLPEKMIEKLNASRVFHSGMQMVRQLEFSLLDLNLHRQHPVNVQQVIDEVRQKVSVLLPPAYNRFQHGFAHIFAGGYAAGYYSYKWAEVLSSDAFSRFEASPHILNRNDGEAFLKNILEKGGSAPAATLFRDYRGRAPSVEPLLRHSGIEQTAK